MNLLLTPQSKNFRLFILILLTIIMYAAFFLFLYPELITLNKTLFLTGILLVFGTVLVISFAIWLKSFSEERFRIHQKLRRYEEIISKETHTFYVYEAVKETILLKERGDAIVRYFFKCKNNPDNELNTIRINVYHDGNLKEDSIKCKVNDKEAPITKIERLIILDAKTNKPKTSMPNIFKFNIQPVESIRKGVLFTYSYSYMIEKLYPYVKEPGKEYSQTLILHPTDRLKYIVKAPEGYVFDSVKIEVLDRDEIKHLSEVERMQKEFPPYLTQDKKVLCWDILEPKLANIYRLYFSIKKENK